MYAHATQTMVFRQEGDSGTGLGSDLGMPEDKTLFSSTSPPAAPQRDLLTRFMKSFFLLLTPRRDRWMLSTCFLQSSCVCTSRPPLSYSHPLHLLWVPDGASRPSRLFMLQTVLITHRHTYRRVSCFGFSWLRLGYKVVLVLTMRRAVGLLLLCCIMR